MISAVFLSALMCFHRHDNMYDVSSVVSMSSILSDSNVWYSTLAVPKSMTGK